MSILFYFIVIAPFDIFDFAYVISVIYSLFLTKNIIHSNWKYIDYYKFKIAKNEKYESTNSLTAPKLTVYNNESTNFIYECNILLI
jgi:hypothetical protein